MSCLNVITGPSGVGKGTLVQMLIERNPDLWLSISATTRKPRAGEIHGLNYFFMENNEFKKSIKNNDFIEWAEFSGNFYGTPIRMIDEKLSQNINVILEIEVIGARQVKKVYPDCRSIFILPPSFNELESRIRGRGTESESSINRRLDRAKYEISVASEFDHKIINDNLGIALKELEGLIKK